MMRILWLGVTVVSLTPPSPAHGLGSAKTLIRDKTGSSAEVREVAQPRFPSAHPAQIQPAAAEGKGEEIAEVRKILQQALQAAATIKDDTQRASALGDVAAAQTEAGDRAGAAATLRQALQTAATIKGDSTKVVTLSVIARAQAEGADMKGVLRIAATINNEALKSTALKLVALWQAKAGDVKGALAWAANEPSPILRVS